jgi:hypothetical protein
MTLSFSHIDLESRQQFGLKVFNMLKNSGYKVSCIYSYYFVEIDLK